MTRGQQDVIGCAVTAGATILFAATWAWSCEERLAAEPVLRPSLLWAISVAAGILTALAGVMFVGACGVAAEDARGGSE
jgi:hypothetical protein